MDKANIQLYDNRIRHNTDGSAYIHGFIYSGPPYDPYQHGKGETGQT